MLVLSLLSPSPRPVQPSGEFELNSPPIFLSLVLCLLKIVKTARTSKRGQGRRPNRSARANPLGATHTTAAKNAAKKAAVAPGRAVAPQQTAEKIMVSGLPTDVNEQQIKVDLFFFDGI